MRREVVSGAMGLDLRPSDDADMRAVVVWRHDTAARDRRRDTPACHGLQHFRRED